MDWDHGDSSMNQLRTCAHCGRDDRMMSICKAQICGRDICYNCIPIEFGTGQSYECPLLKKERLKQNLKCECNQPTCKYCHGDFISRRYKINELERMITEDTKRKTEAKQKTKQYKGELLPSAKNWNNYLNGQMQNPNSNSNSSTSTPILNATNEHNNNKTTDDFFKNDDFPPQWQRNPNTGDPKVPETGSDYAILAKWRGSSRHEKQIWTQSYKQYKRNYNR